ncbi:MAG: peptidase prepilin type [Phycisphaerales bacterium]|nr:peptidase prepilin type [Phycisphaerales bacterium]
MMAMREFLQFVPLLALLVWAAVVDLRIRRIPNWMTGALVASGLAQSGLAFWSLSSGQAWAGLGAGFGLTFILFALGAMGGADVKLFAGIGAWVGPMRVVEIFAAEAVIGMVIVLAQAMQRRRVGTLMRNSAVLVMNAAVSGDLSCPPEESQKSGGAAGEKRLPYAVPALVATVAVLALGRRWM